MRVFASLMALGGLPAVALSQTPRPRPTLALELLPQALAVCRLAPTAEVPTWAQTSTRFLTISRTSEELSVVAEQRVIPETVACERDYRAFRVKGPLPLNLIGILASIAEPLAEAGISIFAISTYDTDYVLVKSADLDAARRVLEHAGHHVR